jgi:beta-1,4-mannosyl-glycoprotein beta-1,4-N-acetylglucosaminyltransferase
MKTFDCFPFYNEFDQLRLRLKVLGDAVDHFIVTEARQTHAGQAKPLYLEDPAAQDILDHPKVTRVVVDFPSGLDVWGREQYQREAISQGLTQLGAKAEDFVLVSDVDEIPSVDAIARAKSEIAARSTSSSTPSSDIANNNTKSVSGGINIRTPRFIAVFEQRLFYFRLNYELIWSRKLPWLGTVMARYDHILSVNGLRTTGRNARGRKSLGFDAGAKVLTITNGGWHFSYLGGDAALDAKLAACAHQEHNTAEYRQSSVAELIRDRRGLHDRPGLHQVWAVIPADQIGIAESVVHELSLSHLVESNPDSVRDIVARIQTKAMDIRAQIGRVMLGLR